MASILRWNIDQVKNNSDQSGKLFETFIFNELAALTDTGDGEYELYHYRDREQTMLSPPGIVSVKALDDHILLVEFDNTECN